MNQDQAAPQIIVLDRQHPEFEQSLWSVRRHLGDALDKAFAAWATSSERGRFIVLAAVEGFTIEQGIGFANDEEELVRLVAERVSHLPGGIGHVKPLVAPELAEKLRTATPHFQRGGR